MLNIDCIDTMLDLVLVEIFHCMFWEYRICDKPRAQFCALCVLCRCSCYILLVCLYWFCDGTLESNYIYIFISTFLFDLTNMLRIYC
jgi:hypothetical protein